MITLMLGVHSVNSVIIKLQCIYIKNKFLEIQHFSELQVLYMENWSLINLISKTILHLSYSPFDHRATSDWSTIHFFKVIVWMADIFCHLLSNVITVKNSTNYYTPEVRVRVKWGSSVEIYKHTLSFRNKSHVISSVLKLMMVLMKFSRMIFCLSDFQSMSFSPSNVQIPSKASLTAGGGLGSDRTSTRFCFFIPLTAAN